MITVPRSLQVSRPSFKTHKFKVKNIAFVLLLSFIIQLMWSIEAEAQSSKYKQIVPIVPAADDKDPFWYNAPAKSIAYGIEILTYNSTDDEPTIIIYGTKGKTRPFRLNNEPDNFEENQTDYFLYAAAEVGNVGIPIAVEVQAGGDDGWQFRDLKIDIFAGEGWNFSSQTWYGRMGVNDRTKAITSGSPWDYQKVLVDRIVFDGDGGVDGDGSNVGAYNLENTAVLHAIGAKLGSTHSVVVPIATQMIIVDARHSPEPIYWNSVKDARISGSQVLKSLQRREKEAGISNTVTVTASSETEAEGGGLKEKGTFSVSESFTISASTKKVNQDENIRKVDQAFGSSDGQKYTVSPGSVAFFEMVISTQVDLYSDFSKLTRINPASVSPSYSLAPKYFRTECSTGELRELNIFDENSSGRVQDINLNAQFSLGKKLKDPSMQKYLNAAKSAWGNFPTSMNLSGNKCAKTIPSHNVPSSASKEVSSGGSGPVSNFKLVNDISNSFYFKWLDSSGGEVETSNGWIQPGRAFEIKDRLTTYESHWFSIYTEKGFVCSFSPREGAVVNLSELSNCSF